MSFDFQLLSVIGRCEGVPGGQVRLVKERSSKESASTKSGRTARLAWQGDEEYGKDRLFVLKVYNLEAKNPADFYDWAEYIANEAVTMRQFRHPNVLPCLASYVSGPEIVIVVPRMPLGSVRDLLDSHFTEGLPEMAIAIVVRDVLLALQYLHSKGIVHRSVRASHILLSENGSARLTGLRYSTSLMHSGHGLQDRYDYPLHVARTNLNWLSPEFLQQNLLGYNERTDIYSLGVTVCESANGMVPFSEMPATLMLLEKLRGAAPKLIDSTTIQTQQDQGFNPDLPADSGVGASVGSCTNMTGKESAYARRTFTDAFHDFVENCCQLDASLRPSAPALLAGHPFIKQLKKTAANMTLASMLEPAKAKAVAAVVAKEEDKVEELQELSLMGDWDF